MGKWKAHEAADAACARWAAAQHGLVTRSQALDAGLSRVTVDGRLRVGAWTDVHRGVYRVSGAEPTWLSEVMAAALATKGAAVGECGAALWGFDGVEPPTEIQIITRHDRRLERTLAQVTVAGWASSAHLTRREQVPVLQPPWLLLTLGAYAARDTVEAVLDDCIRRKFTTWEELEALATSEIVRSHRGPAVLRELLVLRAQRQHTHSYLETLTLQLLRNNGLSGWVLQYPLKVGPGVTLHADLAFPEHHLLIETVGAKAHRSELWQYSRDCQRSNAVNLLEQRFRVLHYTWHQVTREPEAVVAQIRQCLGLGDQQAFRMLERRGGPALLALPLK